MPGATRQRGATAVPAEQAQLPQCDLLIPRLPRQDMLTAAVIMACVLLVIFLTGNMSFKAFLSKAF